MQRIIIHFSVSELHQGFHIPCNKPFTLRYLTFKNPMYVFLTEFITIIIKASKGFLYIAFLFYAFIPSVLLHKHQSANDLIQLLNLI